MSKLQLPVFGFEFHETESTMAHDTELSAGIPEIWAQQLLKAIYAKSAMITSVRRDYEALVSKAGDTVNIQKLGTLTTADKIANQRVTYQNPSLTTVPVTLDNHRIVPIMVEDRGSSLANSDVIAGYIDDAVDAIVLDVEASLTALHTDAGHNVDWDATSGDTILTSILAGRTALMVDEKMPGAMPKYLVIRDLAEMLAVDRFTSADFVASRPTETGEIGNLVDFVVKESPNIETVVSPSGTHRIMFGKEGIALVSRPLALPRPGIGAKAALVQKDGLSVRVVQAYDPGYQSEVVTIDLLWGVAVVIPEFVVDLYEGN